MVYSHAFVVICGPSSPNPQEPILDPSEPEWLPKQFDVPWCNRFRVQDASPQAPKNEVSG
ncbi:hypothetical protein QR685DRAFT_537870 [Neurospora intermedia]|uniref:Uncharacterized protein n=1 Tax=Neurospora intermedia TaxID=5142 RepID=A0ABR3D0W1_NEUIN